jgi:hypothetical protein
VNRFAEGSVIAFLLALAGCGVCSEEVIGSARSRDGVLTATWFVKDCGATTDFSTGVSVHRSDSTFKDDGDIVFVVKGRGSLSLLWDGPRSLRIECGGCSRQNVFRRVTSLGDVDISYK